MIPAPPTIVVQIAFGALAGTAFVTFILFALETARSRGWLRAILCLVATLLALLLLLLAASQLQLVMASGKIDPETLLPAFIALTARMAFLGALLASVAVGLFAWVTREGFGSSDADPALADPALEAPF